MNSLLSLTVLFCFLNSSVILAGKITWLENKIDTTKNPSLTSAKFICKNFDLRYSELIEKNKLSQMHKMNSVDITHYKIAEIDAFMENSYTYHFVDTVCQNALGCLLLIAREYINENIIWLCKFDKNNKLVFTKEVYYDNAEGNYQVEAKSISNTISIKSDDINEGKKMEKYKITEKLNLVKLN